VTDRFADTALVVLAPRARSAGVPNAGDPDSLQNVNTFELPDGSLCWTIDNATLYRLDRNSTSNVGTIVPIAGPGRWVPLAGNGVGLILSHSGEAVLTAPGIIGMAVIDRWENLDSLGAVFIGSNGSDFALNPTGGVLTYSGLSGKWVKLSVELTGTAAGAGPYLYETALDINGALLPSVSTPNAAAETLSSGNQQTMATSVFAQLNSGDVIRVLVRNRTDTFGMVVIYVHLHVVPIN
jgi:hypothetical protein